MLRTIIANEIIDFRKKFATTHGISNQVTVKAHIVSCCTLWELAEICSLVIGVNVDPRLSIPTRGQLALIRSLSNLSAKTFQTSSHNGDVDIHGDIRENSTTETSNAWRRMLQKARTRSTVKEVEKRCDTEMTVVIPQLDQPRSTRAEDMTLMFILHLSFFQNLGWSILVNLPEVSLGHLKY